MNIHTGIDFVTPYNTLFAGITGALGTGLFVVLGMVGVGLIIWALGSWAWNKRKGQGRPLSWMSVLIGGVLVSPALLIPLILGALGLILTGIIAAGTWVLAFLPV